MKKNSLDQHLLISNFNKAAPHYAETSLLQQEIGQRLIERLDYIKVSGTQILDLGCGTGYCTRLLAKRYPHSHIVGIDLAEQMLNVAVQSPLPNIEYQHADATHINLPDHSIDLIFSNLLLHWCDASAIFAECRRLLKPNGLLLFSTLGPDTLQELRYAWAHADQAIHVNQFTDMHDLGDLLVELQFADPVMDSEFLTVTFTDAIEAMHSLKTTGAQNINISRASSLTSKQKLQKVIAAYETLRDEEGLLPLTYEVIYGHAWQIDFTRQQMKHDDGTVSVPLNLIKR